MNKENTTEYSNEVFVAGEGRDAIEFAQYRGNARLKKLIIAESVKEIKGSAFRDCTELRAVRFADGLEKLGSAAFEGCTSLEKVVLPPSLADMDWNAFEGCTSLKTAVIQSRLPAVHGFTGCTALEKVIIRGAGYLGIDCFRGCTSLKEIELPDDLERIGERAFLDCAALERIEIPDSVRDIGERAFANCTALCDIDIFSKHVKIHYGAFAGCTALERIRIGRGVKLGISVFRDCVNLKRIVVTEDSRYYTSDGCLVDKNDDMLIWSPDGRIPACAKGIGGGLFYRSKIKSFTVPHGIEAIDDYAFADSDLEQITLPNTVKRISLDAFEDCFGLRTVYFKGTRYEWNEVDVDYDSYVCAYDNGDDCNLVKGIDYDGSIQVICDDD